MKYELLRKDELLNRYLILEDLDSFEYGIEYPLDFYLKDPNKITFFVKLKLNGQDLFILGKNQEGHNEIRDINKN